MEQKKQKALVLGAGIGGIRAALDLARTGYGVTLVDKASHIGGVLTRLDRQFPSNRCGMCKMLPMTDRDSASQYCLRKGLFHDNIRILLKTELTSFSGEPGNFTVTLRKVQNPVNSEKCVGCGLCSLACPVIIADDFNCGFSERKAIFNPLPHAVPGIFEIDESACTKCGECVKACPVGAIDLSGGPRKRFRILVVDDELVVRDSLKEWLDEEGYAVDMAASGKEALEKLTAKPYHLMLTDIKMPEMDGVTLLHKAKELQPDLTVIMMTAYATVETAVEAMKTGALDYVMKPFDTEAVMDTANRLFRENLASEDMKDTFGAVVIAFGADYADPREGKNVMGYGVYPDVLTSVELERLLSGTGPSAGKAVRPSDKGPIKKAAWIQCAGSRDFQVQADFCSSVCCMISIKEAEMVKETLGAETVIFYMDMRTFGKTFQEYKDKAEKEHGVRFERSRVHTLISDAKSGRMKLQYVNGNGCFQEEVFDIVILANGQRPAGSTVAMAEMMGLETNAHGFIAPLPLSGVMTSRAGVFAAGSSTGLKDISETVTNASAAAVEASKALHAVGGSVREARPPIEYRDVSREPPGVYIGMCSCSGRIGGNRGLDDLSAYFSRDNAVVRVVVVDRACTDEGFEALTKDFSESGANRLLIAACHPHLFTDKIKNMSREIGLSPTLMDAVNIFSAAMLYAGDGAEEGGFAAEIAVKRLVSAAAASLCEAQTGGAAHVPIVQSALVVGGGAAGMTAALAIADHGFKTDLVEKKDRLGGNLNWLETTIQGASPKELLKELTEKIEKHPNITVHTNSEIIGAYGEAGNFLTTIEKSENNEKIVQTLHDGAVVIASGGGEFAGSSIDFKKDDRIVTQKEFEIRLKDGRIDPASLSSVVMIQCAGTRSGEFNYCSRICCANALKHALILKDKHPGASVFIIYRDIMSYGFYESYFTEARRKGVIFIQYEPSAPPELTPSESGITVTAIDHVLKRKIMITSDCVVLAKGISPDTPDSLYHTLGLEKDKFGFFSEAESKWRPTSSLKEGVFACGLALAPGNIEESVISAKSAAMQAIGVLWRKSLSAGKNTAMVRHSLCSLCQRCISACPYNARSIDTEEDKIIVNSLMCQGCGACAAICPNGASSVGGFSEKGVLNAIDELMN